MKGKIKKALSIALSTILSVEACVMTVPMLTERVYAEDTVKNLQLVTDVLETNAGARGAATVYYGITDQTWRVIGYGTTGVASEAGKLALLAGNTMGNDSIFNQNTDQDNNDNYAGSILKTAVDDIYSTTYFTEEEMGAIVKRNLDVEEYTGDEPYSDGISGTALTEENAPYLWPLSTKEAHALWENGSLIYDTDSTCWLRSPGFHYYCAATVDGRSHGAVHRTGDNVDNVYGVRPAFNMNLSSILLTSAAVGGKDAGATTGTLKKIDDYSGSDWKLTILDSSRNEFTASEGENAVLSEKEGYTSWTVPVTYSGAQSGTNEHVSAILTNSDGVALYYGHIENSVTIPTGLEAGTYFLKVFNEQCNGEKKTDLSSPMSTITLTVTKPAVAKPTFAPEGNTFTEAQNVVISCTTDGADIYYTTDNTTPSKTNGEKYTSVIPVNKTTTIKAIAVKDGWTDSEVASAKYTISTAPTHDPDQKPTPKPAPIITDDTPSEPTTTPEPVTKTNTNTTTDPSTGNTTTTTTTVTKTDNGTIETQTKTVTDPSGNVISETKSETVTDNKAGTETVTAETKDYQAGTVTKEQSVTDIKTGASEGTSVTSTFDGTVTGITASSTTADGVATKTIYIPVKTETDKLTLTAVTVTGTGEVTVPSGIKAADGKTYTVTGIGKGAFKGDTSIVNVTIPATVTEIGQGAFNGATSVQSITIYVDKAGKLKVMKNAVKGLKKNRKVNIHCRNKKQFEKIAAKFKAAGGRNLKYVFVKMD